MVKLRYSRAIRIMSGNPTPSAKHSGVPGFGQKAWLAESAYFSLICLPVRCSIWIS